MNPGRVVACLFALLLTFALSPIAWGAPESDDESTYLQAMMALTRMAQDPTLVHLKGSTIELRATTTYLQELKAYWMQSVSAPPRYQYINDDFAAYLNNEIDGVSLFADVSAQVDGAKVSGWSSAQAKANAQAELDQSNIVFSAADNGFNALMADLHAELDAN